MFGTKQEQKNPLQTISVPYSCSSGEREFMDSVRRVYSAAVRTAYAATAARIRHFRQEGDRILMPGRA